jgi:PhnB protein
MATNPTPSLSFDDTTRDAFSFCERALGAKIEAMMRLADLPPTPGAPPGNAAGCAVNGAPIAFG